MGRVSLRIISEMIKAAEAKARAAWLVSDYSLFTFAA